MMHPLFQHIIDVKATAGNHQGTHFVMSRITAGVIILRLEDEKVPPDFGATIWKTNVGLRHLKWLAGLKVKIDETALPYQVTVATPLGDFSILI